MMTALAAAKAYAASQGSMATPSLGGTGEAKKAMSSAIC
jgi:flagellar hook-basal body complex protein FliE